MRKTSIAALTLASLALLVSLIPGRIVFAIPLGLAALGLGITALAKVPAGARLALSKVSVSLAVGAMLIAITLTATVPGWIPPPERTAATANSPTESAARSAPRQTSATPSRTSPPSSTPASDPATSKSTASGSTSTDREPTRESGGDRDSAPPKDPGRQTVVVTRVVDGDTFKARGIGKGPVPNREVDVRMLEINTVEQGQCGYDASTDKLTSLLGSKVTIERDQDLKDQYGRWLLYVWSDGMFVNHQMVQTGYAEAVLYEPNDKYWEKISAADTSKVYTPWARCHTPEPDPQEQPPPQNEDDSGGVYVFPPPPPDRDCGSVSASDFAVRPGDPHNFDADGDGIGCESTDSPPVPDPPEQDPADGYPVPPPPPDRDCSDISASNFHVRPGDPHRFDGNGDGIGCES